MVLIGHAVEEAVVAVKTAASWPVVERARGGSVVGGDEMPFADHEGAVAVGREDLRQVRGGGSGVAATVGKSVLDVDDRANTDSVRIPAGQQRGAGRRANCPGVEVVVSQARGGESVDVRRLDLGTEAAEVREADVVEEHVNDVGAPRLGADGPRIMRLRILVRRADFPLKRIVIPREGRHLRDGSDNQSEGQLAKAGDDAPWPSRSMTNHEFFP